LGLRGESESQDEGSVGEDEGEGEGECVFDTPHPPTHTPTHTTKVGRLSEKEIPVMKCTSYVTAVLRF
jgi:hypothetical protein